MLTGDLVRARVRGNRIEPSFVDPGSERLQERAEGVLGLFSTALEAHWTEGELTMALRELEGDSTDHKLVRGLAKVMVDRSEFETKSPIEPALLRARVFGRAALTGPLARSPGPTGRRTAVDVLREIFQELVAEGVVPDGPTAELPDIEALQRALYADLSTEQRLVSCRGPAGPRELLDRYNVALVQSLLLRAERMRLVLHAPDPGRTRQLFRYLKFFQLMYRVHRVDGLSAEALALEIDGPASLLKQSSRYGLQLAQLLPAVLLQTGSWELDADVLWGNKRKVRKALLLGDKLGLKSHYRDRGAWLPRAGQWFEDRWVELDTGWTLTPGLPIDLGGQEVLIPDFTLRRGDRVAHLDIVGFWRKGYLDKRLARTPPNVVLAVSRRLAGDDAALPARLADQIVQFAEIIPANQVLARVEAIALPPGPAPD